MPRNETEARIEAVESELDKLRKNGGGDPAPSASALAAKRMTTLVQECIDKPIQELVDLRDEVDALIISMQAQGEFLARAAGSLAGNSEAVMAAKEVMKAEVAAARATFEAMSQTKMPLVITGQHVREGRTRGVAEAVEGMLGGGSG